MRRFALVNEAGARRDISTAPGVWLDQPTGLGVSLAPVMADYYHGFFAAVSTDAEPQGSIYGDLVFSRRGRAYEDYRELVDWIMAAGSLELIYIPYGSTEYHRAVTVTVAEKGELDQVGWLRVPVTLVCLTPWYRPIQQSVALVPVASAAMRYPYAYTPSLVYASSNVGNMAADVTASGHQAASVALTYTGALTNPTIRLEGSGGALLGSCALTADLAEGDRLEYSSRPLASYVRKIAADGTETDLLPTVDLSSDPFLRIPTGQGCRLSLTSQAAIAGTAELRIYEYYRSV